jgi:hypothetical protein
MHANPDRPWYAEQRTACHRMLTNEQIVKLSLKRVRQQIDEHFARARAAA